MMCTPTQGVWQPAGCVSCELVCVCVSLVRVVIICPASTHTALVSTSPSLTVLHLSTLPSSAQRHRTYFLLNNKAVNVQRRVQSTKGHDLSTARICVGTPSGPISAILGDRTVDVPTAKAE